MKNQELLTLAEICLNTYEAMGVMSYNKTVERLYNILPTEKVDYVELVDTIVYICSRGWSVKTTPSLTNDPDELGIAFVFEDEDTVLAMEGVNGVNYTLGVLNGYCKTKADVNTIQKVISMAKRLVG